MIEFNLEWNRYDLSESFLLALFKDFLSIVLISLDESHARVDNLIACRVTVVVHEEDTRDISWSWLNEATLSKDFDLKR